MRPFFQAVVLVVLWPAITHAEFELRFDEQATVLPNATHQTVDLFLRNLSNADAQISSTIISAYLGITRQAVFPDSGGSPDYRGPEGNFQVEEGIGGIQVVGSNYFWNEQGIVAPVNEKKWGENVAQVRVSEPRGSYRTLAANSEAKLATFHIDTTDMTTDELNIALNDQFSYSPDYFTPTQIQALNAEGELTLYAIGNGVTVVGGNYQLGSVSSTPEPAVVGTLGLSLAGGAGWLRARARRRAAKATRTA